MNWPALVLFSCTIFTLALALLTARRNAFPAKFYYVGMLLSSAWWSGAAGMENWQTAPADKILWAKLAWLGIVTVPCYWTLFVWAYVKGDDRRPTWFGQLALWLMPLLTCLIAFTNDQHHWLYVSTLPVSDAPGAAIRYEHGPWFYLCALYLYGYMTLSMLVIINALARANALYRQHYLGLAIAMAIPWLANAAHLTGLVTLFDFDPTPFSFLIMGGIFYWLITHRQWFDLLPIAHDVLFDAIPDAVLVINDQQQIARLNHAARALPNMPANAIGLPLKLLPSFDNLLPTLWDRLLPVEFELQLGDAYFDLRSVTIYYLQQPIGLLLVLRNITHHKHNQLALQQALISLEAQLESNAQLQQQLHQAAILDPLTNLHNRRFLDEVTPNLLSHSTQQQQTISLVMIDLDHFKTINDHYGHSAGDEVLRHMAQLLRRYSRQTDLLFRLGGEEFLVIFPDTSATQALRLTEVWREQLLAQPALVHGTPMPVTFSAGIVEVAYASNTFDTAIAYADMALYRAKDAGRNRSELASPKHKISIEPLSTTAMFD
ncbi:histidine kinase N-terminal 7TM domain-containing protein [Deefgea piscis]|uniref:histidine kinase N-terminal 7TM domain-containing protein n=1 Tax=Deefgea piscis TaxID=2739061 RepID=UPI001C811EB6|nr:histidine kinase N-terminal 7TM domain-containing protein [Deefgea piscis]QZA81450.1 diguanylate cyclase [Deefgea piscis]